MIAFDVAALERAAASEPFVSLSEGTQALRAQVPIGDPDDDEPGYDDDEEDDEDDEEPDEDDEPWQLARAHDD